MKHSARWDLINVSSFTDGRSGLYFPPIRKIFIEYAGCSKDLRAKAGEKSMGEGILFSTSKRRRLSLTKAVSLFSNLLRTKHEERI
jgi:hypothetical protein